MIVSAAKTALKRYGFDDTDPLNAWLDQAKNELEVSYDWPFLQSIFTDPVAIGDNQLTLPADYFKVQSVRDTTNNRKLQYRDIDGFERDITDSNETGLPSIYTVIGASGLQLWPVSDSNWDARVVYQQALADINGLADGALLPGPTRIHYLYVIGAAYIGLQAENEEERSGNAQAMFEKGIARLIRKYSSYLGESKTVIDVMGYGRG